MIRSDQSVRSCDCVCEILTKDEGRERETGEHLAQCVFVGRCVLCITLGHDGRDFEFRDKSLRKTSGNEIEKKIRGTIEQDRIEEQESQLMSC